MLGLSWAQKHPLTRVAGTARAASRGAEPGSPSLASLLVGPAPPRPSPPHPSRRPLLSYWPRPVRGAAAPGRPRPNCSLHLHWPVPPRLMTPPLLVSLPLPQAPPPPSLLGAAGPGVWRCRSRARPGSAATATAIAGSSSPSTGEARGPASPGPAAAAPAGAPGLARGGWGRRGRCPAPGRPEGVRPSPSRRGGGPGTGEVPAREARRHLGRLGARGDGRRG